MEIWKPIPQYEGLYEISNKCNVKSLPKIVIRDKCGILEIKERIIKTNNSNQVKLYKDKIGKFLCIKKLYMKVFESKIIETNKYESLTFDDKTPILISRRKLIAHAKKYQKTKKCKLTGVSLNTSVGKKYQAQIHINKKNIYLGKFEKELDANLMYRKAVKYINLYNNNPKEFRNLLHSLTL